MSVRVDDFDKYDMDNYLMIQDDIYSVDWLNNYERGVRKLCKIRGRLEMVNFVIHRSEMYMDVGCTGFFKNFVPADESIQLASKSLKFVYDTYCQNSVLFFSRYLNLSEDDRGYIDETFKIDHGKACVVCYGETLETTKCCKQLLCENCKVQLFDNKCPYCRQAV